MKTYTKIAEELTEEASTERDKLVECPDCMALLKVHRIVYDNSEFYYLECLEHRI
jgi:hypothetical protein